MTDPFRERRLQPGEARRILRRAIDLADRDPSTSAALRPLTLDELARTAEELGLPASAVAEAAGEDADDAPGGSPGGERSIFLGAPTRVVREIEVAGEPSDADREDLVEEIREVVGETGSVESVGKTMVWKIDPGYQGRGRDFSVRLRSRDGRTRVVVEERLGRQALALFLGLGLGGGIGPLGGYIAAVAKLGAVGLVFPLVWIPLLLVLARTIYGAIAARRERLVAKVMRKVERRAKRWAAPDDASRKRIDAVPRARVATGTDDEAAAAEAEADEEAGASRVGRA
jgi:hypothetical protein